MGRLLAAAVALALLWLVVRFVRGRFSSRAPAVSPQCPTDGVEDPFTGVRSPKKHGPPNRSGAVALEEPEEEDVDSSFPPRQM